MENLQMITKFLRAFCPVTRSLPPLFKGGKQGAKPRAYLPHASSAGQPCSRHFNFHWMLLGITIVGISVAYSQIDTTKNETEERIMKERRYTVSEIDELRKACELRWLFGTTYMEGSRSSRNYYENDKTKGVEELVRTYMMAGIVAKDIYEEDRQRHEKFNKSKKP